MAGPNTGRGGLTVRQQLMHKMAAVSDQYRIKPVLELAVESERARRAQMRQRQDFRRKPRPGAGDEIEADTRRLDAAMMHSINPKCGRCGALLMTNRVKLCGGDVCLKTLKDQELLERLRVEREDFIARRAVRQTPGLDEDDEDEDDDESLGDEDTDEDYDEDDEDEEEDEDDDISQGMLPNRFPDSGAAPEYNTADATLWYFEAIRAYHAATGDADLFEGFQSIFAGHLDIESYNVR